MGGGDQNVCVPLILRLKVIDGQSGVMNKQIVYTCLIRTHSTVIVCMHTALVSDNYFSQSLAPIIKVVLKYVLQCESVCVCVCVCVVCV